MKIKRLGQTMLNKWWFRKKVVEGVVEVRGEKVKRKCTFFDLVKNWRDFLMTYLLKYCIRKRAFKKIGNRKLIKTIEERN